MVVPEISGVAVTVTLLAAFLMTEYLVLYAVVVASQVRVLDVGAIVPVLGSLGRSAKYLATKSVQRSTAGSVPLHVAVGLQINAAVAPDGIPVDRTPLLSALY